MRGVRETVSTGICSGARGAIFRRLTYGGSPGRQSQLPKLIAANVTTCDIQSRY